MTKTLTMFAISLLVVFPLLGGVALSYNVPVAGAQQLDSEDFFGDDFTDSTGLGQADLKSTIGNLIRVFLGFLGVIAVVIVLLGGFKWMTASGNEDKVSDAKKMLIAGIIGLAIILAAYAITSFVIESILTASA
ncbi:hypothetical protein KJ673_01050 [Patescibacteria group bacterium]|nr:hypothetical protein [Patescibacteria group bacterium]MBU4453030.1 hypothetical protein [Patescibacteria group bacterium]MCG2687522.1 hypothetical protein [Candidatus Parcubacteria bacterium]